MLCHIVHHGHLTAGGDKLLAAGKSKNVHRVFKPKTEADTEGLTHDTDAKPKS